MAITLWQIDECNKANRKLAESPAREDVAAEIRALCAKHGAPYYEGDPKRSFADLFRVVATSDNFRTDPTESPDVRRGQRESHEQAVCEEMAAGILARLGIDY